MTYQINPTFDRFPEEANLVGRILSSFGELELTICHSAQMALNLENDAVLKTLYRIRATSSRIDTADGLMRSIYEKHGLIESYTQAMSMLRHCLIIRNQYAHCNWADHVRGGLFFADLQTSAKNQNFDHHYRHVDVPLLTAQLDYFKVTIERLRSLDHQLMVKEGRPTFHAWPEPPSSTPPLLHNPPSQHVPPWLSPELQEAHLKRALESEQRDQQSERPPSVLRLTREEWAAKDAKEARLASQKPASEEQS